MLFSLSDILILVTVAQLIVFALILLLHIRKGNKSYQYLAYFFLALGVNTISVFFFRHPDFFRQYALNLFYLGIPLAYVYSPLFYLYVIFTLNYRKKFRTADLMHFLPGAVFFVYILVSFTFRPLPYKNAILDRGGPSFLDYSEILTALVHVQVLIYLVFTILKIRKTRKEILNFYSSSSKANFSWISNILGSMVCLWLLDVARFFVELKHERIINSVEIILFSGFVVFSYFFIYKALTSGTFIPEITTSNSQQYSLSARSRETYYEKLRKLMDEQKLFLDPELTLSKLSDSTKIPVRSLSEVINTRVGQNFYDYINSYRIREALDIFTSSTGKQKTVLEVLYESGFNNKSSFNQAFKKQTGHTPTEFRRKHITTDC